MGEQLLRQQIQAAANAIIRAATRSDGEERNRDAALAIVGVMDQIQVLVRKLYAIPDAKAIR